MSVVVVGGGVLGFMHALEARRRGHPVTHLEREPGARGASVRNFGLMVFWRLTENSETSAPPILRDPRPPISVITSRKIQVTNSASSEAATEIGPLVWSNATIHTGNV